MKWGHLPGVDEIDAAIKVVVSQLTEKQLLNQHIYFIDRCAAYSSPYTTTSVFTENDIKTG